MRAGPSARRRALSARPGGLRSLAAVAAVALASSACGNDPPKLSADTSPATTAKAPSGPDAGKALTTVKAGKLTACTAVPHAPFELDDAGNLDGIDIELVRALAGRLALAPEFVVVDAAGIFGALDAGRCDIVASSVTITAERHETVDLSAGYFHVDQSLLVRRGDEARYSDLPALSGRTIGVQTASTGAAYARARATGATIKELPAADELFAALKAGQVDAVLQDHPANAYHAVSGGDSVVAKTFTDSAREEYGLAMRKGQTALKSALDDALTEVRSDDTYPTILRRFLGDTAGQN